MANNNYAPPIYQPPPMPADVENVYADVPPSPEYNMQGYAPPIQQAPVKPTGPPPCDPEDDNPANYQYNYNKYDIQYAPMTVSDWDNIPADKSEYSKYWDSKDCFEPENFEKETTAETRWNDLGWMIAFWINFIVTLAVFGWLAAKEPDYDEYNKRVQNSYIPYSHLLATTPTTDDNYQIDGLTDIIKKCAGAGFGLALLFNAIHYCYATFAPIFYIRFGLFVAVLFTIIFALIPSLLTKSFIFMIFPAVFLIIIIVVFCCNKKYIELSAAVLRATMIIILKNPMIIAFALLDCIVEVLVSALTVAWIYYIEAKYMNRGIYVYVLFSYLWMMITFSYVIYMTGAGLSATYYFLGGTDYFPRFPTLQSFKRACTSSFGTCALAGFILTIINLLEALVYGLDVRVDGPVGILICVLRCVALCILRIINAIFSFIARYGLIYCAIFGIPFKEGCRRWVELSCTKFIDVICTGCIVKLSLNFNMIIFAIGSALVGYGVGFLIGSDDTRTYAQLYACLFTLVFTLCIFVLLEQPIETMSDTLFVCFAEAPDKFAQFDNPLYEQFVKVYGERLETKTK